MKCCICKAKIVSDLDSHNAEPVKAGRCCGYCNDTVVIPTRLSRVAITVFSKCLPPVWQFPSRPASDR